MAAKPTYPHLVHRMEIVNCPTNRDIEVARREAHAAVKPGDLPFVHDAIDVVCDFYKLYNHRLSPGDHAPFFDDLGKLAPPSNSPLYISNHQLYKSLTKGRVTYFCMVALVAIYGMEAVEKSKPFRERGRWRQVFLLCPRCEFPGEGPDAVFYRHALRQSRVARKYIARSKSQPKARQTAGQVALSGSLPGGSDGLASPKVSQPALSRVTESSPGYASIASVDKRVLGATDHTVSASGECNQSRDMHDHSHSKDSTGSAADNTNAVAKYGVNEGPANNLLSMTTRFADPTSASVDVGAGTVEYLCPRHSALRSQPIPGEMPISDTARQAVGRGRRAVSCEPRTRKDWDTYLSDCGKGKRVRVNANPNPIHEPDFFITASTK